MAESRFQKSFFVDSGLSKGAQSKRAIRPNHSAENDFFAINYQHATPNDQGANQNSKGGCPWGTNDGESEQLSLSQSRGRPDNKLDVKQHLDKNNEFYEANPQYKVTASHHRERNLLEKAKGVPWGTEYNDDESAKYVPIKRGAKPTQSNGAPFATSEDAAPPAPIERPNPNDGDRAISQVTF